MNYFDKDQVTGYVQGLDDAFSEVENKIKRINDKIDKEVNNTVASAEKAGIEVTSDKVEDVHNIWEHYYEKELELLEDLRSTMLKTLLTAKDYLEGFERDFE